MANAEAYANWIIQNKDKAGTPEFETVAAAYKAARALPAATAPAAPKEASPLSIVAKGARVVSPLISEDTMAGAIRGAGSIGATLMWPIDKATDLIKGDRGPNVTGLVTGQQPLTRNQERRKAMDDALRELGADPSSFGYQAAKLGGEVAGTAGAGGAAGNLLARLPGAASAMPAINAIRTSGMSTGLAPVTMAGRAGDLALRSAGGAISGGLSAGLVNPEDAGAGAVIGGAAPGVFQAAGRAGQAVGRAVRGPAQSPEWAAAVQQARANGYVIPPTQAKPSLGNRMLEGFSGKITTAQNASAQNQGVTNQLAAKALGLPPTDKITPDVLANVRKTAGQAYDALAQSGTVNPGKGYEQALDAIAAPFVKASQAFPNAKPSPVLDLVESLRSPSFDAGAAVEKVKQLRTAADDAFRTGNTDVARAAKAGAKALEDALESHLQSIGQPDLLAQFRDARQLIAKTYTVEKALNPASGSVDARKLAADLKKGKPLTTELRQAGEFASQFPKAAQSVEGMGSLPQTSPLDWHAMGAGSIATGNPLMMLGVAARPAARAAVLSPLVQNRLIQQPTALNALLGGPVQQNLLRVVPLSGGDR